MPEAIYDPKTGEIIDEIPEEELRQARPAQQQFIPGVSQSRKLDGLAIPAAAHTAGDFLNQLNDGKFQAELHQELAMVANALREYVRATQGKAKGTIDVKIEIFAEDDHFRIGADFKSKTPTLPRQKSIAWFDEDGGNFTRFPQNQMQMFEQANARRIG